MNHYTDFDSPIESLIRFGNILREEGFQLGLQCSKDYVDIVLMDLLFQHEYLESAFAALCCNSPKDREQFSKIYKRFWEEKGTRVQSKTNYFNKKKVHKNQKSIVVMTGMGKSDLEGEVEEGKNSSGANAKETLKNTDFSKLSVIQSEELDKLAETLIQDMNLRIKRRQKKLKKGKINIQSSIRKNIQNGGNIIQLIKKNKTKEQFKLLVLLDVSGSMDKYSYYLLKFLWSLRKHFKDLEVFTFSTIMMRITEPLKNRNIQEVLTQVSEQATHWSSGTKIGACFKQFNEEYSRFYLNGKTVTLILSDGLETGEVEDLEEQIKKIKMRSKRLIWLNPLKGMNGYQPIQRGMKAVMPELNHFGAAHNLSSLLELENILTNA